MNNKNVIVAIAVILIAAMFLGEAIVYVANPYSYDADANYDEEGVNFTIETSNNSVYDVLAIDNGGVPPVREVIICSGDDERYLNEIKTELSVRNLNEVSVVAPAELPEVMTDPEGKALIVPRGLFPEEIYTGNSSDPMMEWFDGGGSVYWFGYMPKEGYSIENYLQPMGLSEDDIFVGRDYTASVSGPFCKPLALRNSLVYNGLSADAGTPLAYVSDSGFSSITAKEVSNGSLFVFGGGHTYDNSMDIAQLIVSGITAKSTLIGHWSGTVNGTLTESVKFDESPIIPENIHVYIYIGGYYIVFGKRF